MVLGNIKGCQQLCNLAHAGPGVASSAALLVEPFTSRDMGPDAGEEFGPDPGWLLEVGLPWVRQGLGGTTVLRKALG